MRQKGGLVLDGCFDKRRVRFTVIITVTGLVTEGVSYLISVVLIVVVIIILVWIGNGESKVVEIA